MSFYSSLDLRSLDVESPTIFEILSADELSNLLTPSLRYVLVHYTHKYPRYLLKLYSFFDEINLIGRLAIEYKFLTRWNLTFTEKFYAIKRVLNQGIPFKNVPQLAHKKKLTRRQILGLLFFLVGIPYLRDKLDVVYEKWLAEYLMDKERFSKKDSKTVGKLLFIKLYPFVTTVGTVFLILLLIMYISGKTVFPSVATYLLNMKYIRATAQDEAISKINDSKPVSRIRPLSLGESFQRSGISRLFSPFKFSLVGAFDTVFPVMMFSLKFLEWWQQNDQIRTLLTDNLDNFIKETITSEKSFPVPKAAKPEANNRYTRHEYSDCAICKEEIQNPAVLETGYVFCYPCIMKHLTENKDKDTGGRCPITGIRLLGCQFSEEKQEWKVEGIRRLMG